jgi:hypothetical protein
MPQQNHSTVSSYACKKCGASYDSPIVLSAPPVHRCPSPKSTKTSVLVLVKGTPDLWTQHNETRRSKRGLDSPVEDGE